MVPLEIFSNSLQKTSLDLLYFMVVDRHKLTVFYLKSFDMDSVQVGKAVFGKEIYTTLGIEPRTYS